MSTAASEPRIKMLRVTEDSITADLTDGRVISVPLAWSWRLSQATPEQRSRFELIGDGEGAHWPDIDEAPGECCSALPPVHRKSRLRTGSEPVAGADKGLCMPRISAVLLLAVAATFTVVAAQSPRNAPPADPLTIDEINQRGVMGRLGHPLGTIVRVTGRTVDGDQLRLKEFSGKTVLQIERVDGKLLSSPMLFPFQAFLDMIDDPAAGRRFEYIGYETGAFTGRPQGTFDHVPPIPSTAWRFSTSFEILADAHRSKE